MQTKQLSLLGGKDEHDRISYMMKHIVTNTLAVQYSWAGAKMKIAFKNLRITKCIIGTYLITEIYFVKVFFSQVEKYYGIGTI